MTLWPLFEAAARAHAERPAMVGDETVSYAELHLAIKRRAAFFQERGLGFGDRLALFAPNGPEFLELYFTAAALGAILVPLNRRLTRHELRAILEDAGPKWVVYGGEHTDEFLAACFELDSLEGALELSEEGQGAASDFEAPSFDDSAIAQLYYTSGTTGRPKGVPLSHANVAAHARACVGELHLTAVDVWGHFAPMFHLADAWAVFAISFAGGCHCFSPSFEPHAAFALIEGRGVTITNLVPTMLSLMVHVPEKQRGKTSSLRLLLSGGAPIAPELVLSIEQIFGCTYAQTYGLTETSPFLTLSLPTAEMLALDEAEQARYRARTGRPFACATLRVVGEDSREVPRDDATVGEIQARGPSVFQGYWQRPEESAAAFTDGWFRTGDLATIDALGSLNIVDRKKDVILTGGETVYSTEVENALYTHQLVREAAVFGLPDTRWGEVVTAVVVRVQEQHGRTLRAPELIAHCRLFLAGYKVPRCLLFVEELPKSGSGKVQKRVLRERLGDLALEDFDHHHLRTSSTKDSE